MSGKSWSIFLFVLFFPFAFSCMGSDGRLWWCIWSLLLIGRWSSVVEVTVAIVMMCCEWPEVTESVLWSYLPSISTYRVPTFTEYQQLPSTGT